MSARSKSSTNSECEKVSLQTEQLSKLVCPVCYEYMKPPIMQCENGHGICELCHELLSNCPICQSALQYRRSSNLEILTTLVLFPCKLCHKKFSLDELSLHKCSEESEEPDIICLIGQVYGKCNWRGLGKDMIDHISEIHPNNYWTKKENLGKWNYCHLSNIGIQQVYILDLTEAIFVIVQKYDSNNQSLKWNVSCECEKASNQYVYEIQLYSDYNLDSLKCRNVIENDDNIMMSLPSNNEIVIPITEVEKYLGDNNYVNYKVIIKSKVDIQNDQTVKYYQAFSEIKNDDVHITDANIEKQTCTQKSWHTILDFYNYVKNRLGC